MKTEEIRELLIVSNCGVEIKEMQPYRSGRRNLVLQLYLEKEKTVVLKVASEERRLKMQNEARAIRLMADAGAPVPKLLYDGTRIRGRPPFIFFEDVGGINLKRALFDLDPHQSERIFYELGTIVRKVHDLEGGWSWCENPGGGYQTRSWRGLLSRIFKADVCDIAIKLPDLARQLKVCFAKRLREMAEPQRIALVHRDIQPQNLKLVCGRGLVLLDMETAIIGDPVFDMAVLETTVFDRSPGLREAYYQGYGVQSPNLEGKIGTYVFVMRTHFLAGAIRQNDLERFESNLAIVQEFMRKT